MKGTPTAEKSLAEPEGGVGVDRALPRRPLGGIQITTNRGSLGLRSVF